jgi:acyl-CoA synthetase (NDP forming)
MTQLEFEEAKRILNNYKIDVIYSELAETPTQAVKIAQKIGFPVVLKIDSPKIIHKTDNGCVKTNLYNASSVFTAFDEIMKNAKKITKDIKGVVVQKQAQGIEVIIGAKRDPQFGVVVLFGLGGIYVNLFKDVSMRVYPFTRKDVKQMINEIKAYPLLNGFRGSEKVDFTSLENTILRAGSLMSENSFIKEMDLNPCFASKKGCIVTDIRLVV